jgi:WD40 repeat protein
MLRLEHLDRAAAKDAITLPLDEYNRTKANGNPVTIEPGLIDELLHDLSSVTVASDQGGQGSVSGDGYQPTKATVSIETPFLQMVLTRLWDEEKAVSSRVLRTGTFVKLGRAENIARTHLDKIMDKLTDQERNTAASVLHYLVTPSGSKIAQEPAALVSWAELRAEEVEAILRRLSASDTRILRTVQVPGQPLRYEIFHDVMAQAILNWRTRYDLEQDRLKAERKIAAERARADEELALQKKRARRSRFVAAGLALIALMMVVLALMAIRARYTARARELAAFSTSQLETDPELSLLLAIEAVKMRENRKAIDALKAALLESQVSAIMGAKKGKRIAAVSFSPDGKYVVTGSWDGAVRVWDSSNGHPVTSLPGSTGQVNSASFSADGKYVVAANSDGKALIWEGWNTSSPTLVKTLVEPKGLLTAAFSPDGERILTGGAEGKVRIWEWKNDQQDPSTRPELDIRQAVTAADQRRAAEAAAPPSNPTAQPGSVADQSVSSEPTPLPVATTTSGPGKSISIFKAAFNPADGDYVVVAGLDRRAAFVWNWKKELGADNPVSLLGHRFAVYDAEFSRDGKYVVTGSDDATAMVWDVKNPQKPLQTLNLGTFRVRGVSFSPNDNGKYVATASYDKFGRVWPWSLGQPPPDAPTQIIIFRGHSGLVMCSAFSPDGKFVATGSDDGTARVWRTERVDKKKVDTYSVDQLLELARAQVTRGLTEEEKQKYIDN